VQCSVGSGGRGARMKRTDRSAAALAERTGGWGTGDGSEATAMFRHKDGDGGQGRGPDRRQKRATLSKGSSQANGLSLTALDVSLVHGLERAETAPPGGGRRRHGDMLRCDEKEAAEQQQSSSRAAAVKHATPCEARGAMGMYIPLRVAPRCREREVAPILLFVCSFIDNTPSLAGTGTTSTTSTTGTTGTGTGTGLDPSAETPGALPLQRAPVRRHWLRRL
jgi:hypothetical protein